MSAHNCESKNCGQHKGAAKPVQIQRGIINWGIFYYCEKAIKDRQSRGFTVKAKAA